MKTRILITGGSGFIGTNLVNYFRGRAEVVNIDIVKPRDISQLGFWKNVDILDYDALEKVVCEFCPQYLIHMAARTDLDEKSDLDGYRVNIQGVQNVINSIKAARGLERAIFASSMLVCEVGYRPMDYNQYRPSTLYGESKVLGEKLVKEPGKLQSPWVIVRPTSIWGPWFGKPYKDFFDIVIKRKFYHPGEMACSKTYGYIGNSVHQIGKMLTAPLSEVNHKTFYLGDSPPINISEWANEIALELGFPKPKYLPFFVFKIAALVGDQLTRRNIEFPMTSFRLKNMTTDNIYDLSDLQRVVGDVPYSRKQGVTNTLEWIRKHDPAFENE